MNRIMASSQEKTMKNFNTIENNIKKTILQKKKQNVIEKYMQFVQEENEFEIKDENGLKPSHQSLYENVQNCPLANRYLALQGTVEIYKRRLKELEEEIINLTIQSIADTESFKIQEAERERLINNFYMTEENKAMQELENLNKECGRTEQEIKDQIASAITAKNSKLEETKNNLQRQIIEKNTDFFNLQTENWELRKKLDDIKLKAQQNVSKTNYRSNVIYFEDQYLANKEKQNYIPKKSTIYHEFKEETTNKKSLTNRESLLVGKSEKLTKVAIPFESTESKEWMNEGAIEIAEPAKHNQFNLFSEPESYNESYSPTEPKINSMNIDPLEDPKRYHAVENTNTSRKLPTLYLGKSKKPKQIIKY